MKFQVLPAIDVAGGRLVSVSAGGSRPVDAFGGSPLNAARAFVRAGARWLHVVDVDRAEGRSPDLELLASLAGLGAAVQASGGVESQGAARAALEAGAARVVLGSATLADRATAGATIAALGEAAVVGIEADGEVIRPRSAAPVELPLAETLEWLSSARANRYLYTGVARVAGLAGPDVEGARAAARALGRPVLVAGGIRGIEDAVALRDCGPEIVEGVVVGRALYEGLNVGDVLSAVG